MGTKKAAPQSRKLIAKPHMRVEMPFTEGIQAGGSQKEQQAAQTEINSENYERHIAEIQLIDVLFLDDAIAIVNDQQPPKDNESFEDAAGIAE